MNAPAQPRALLPEAGPPARARRRAPRIALVGMPNTGKSTLFNRLTGGAARVANWPGMTVDLAAARVLLGARMVEVVDLPGLYSLHGYAEDEQLVRDFLERERPDLLLVVLNASQIERQLPLLLQVAALGLPAVLALNMADEARAAGVRIDHVQLATALQLPVSVVSGKRGDGIGELKRVLAQTLAAPAAARPVAHEPLRIDDPAFAARAASLVAAAVQTPHVLPARWTDRLDRVLLHPWLGIPLFFLMIYGLFEAVYGLGTPLQDGMKWLIEALKTDVATPLLTTAPVWLRSFVLEGLIDGVGTVLSFLPIILVFFALMAVVEDSGYLARVAFLMDRAMHRLGLDGRGFVMQLMGLGCNVPALMGTRVIRSRPQRLLAMLVIPFSLCSARLQVLVFISAVFFSAQQAPLVMFSLYAVSFAVAVLTALVWKRRYAGTEPLVLEFPPYRMPTLRTLAAQAWQSSRHFLESAAVFILAGVLLIWLLTHVPFSAEPASAATLAGRLATWMEPVFAPIGVDALLSVALLFGFVAKEIVLGGLAVIYGAGQDELGRAMAAHLTWIQAYSFMLFTLIYTPCLSSLATIRRESKSLPYTLLVLGWSLGVAWLVAFVFYQVASRVAG